MNITHWHGNGEKSCYTNGDWGTCFEGCSVTELEADRANVSKQIAEALNETMSVPCQQIAAIVEHCGAEFAIGVVNEALDIESKGGMMLADQSRRRTIGGIFFFLVRGRITQEQHQAIFGATRVYPHKKKKGKGKGGDKANKQPKAPPEPPLPEFEWADRVTLLNTLVETRGEATIVKVTLIGRPNNVELRKDLAILVMEHTLSVQAMPKGVPKPPPATTLYAVYIGMKQWRKVEPALANPEDALIIEGVTGFDPEINAMAIYANNVTTKLMQRQKREGQAAPAEKGAAPAPKASRSAPPPAAPVMPEFPVPPNAPPEAVGKLRELHAAAGALRQKLNGLQANPNTQQFILSTTQKSLKSIEDQIAALERQYS